MKIFKDGRIHRFGKDAPAYGLHRFGKDAPMYGVHKFGEDSPGWKGGKVKRTCKVCGKTFEIFPAWLRKKGRGNFCSRDCVAKYRRRREKICKYCGKTFQPKSTKVIFCSRKCWEKDYSRSRSTTRKCLYCGESFRIHLSATKYQGSNYCSLKCYGLARRKRVIKKCVICGKKYISLISRVAKSKCCSLKCNGVLAVKSSKNKNTSLELKVDEILNKLGIKYESQKVIPEGRTVADFYIPEQRLVIYADGWYWHKSKQAELKGVPKKDITQEFLLNFNGYKVLRLPESEIEKNPEKCLRKIKKLFNS